MPLRPRVAALLAVGVLVVLAAGCGGGGGNDEAEQWASDLCSTIASWKSDIDQITQDATDALTKPGTTKQDLEDAVNKGLDSTKTLADDLKALKAPATDQGQQAKQQVDAFVADVQHAATEVKTTLQGIPASANLTQVVTRLTGLATTLQTPIRSGVALVGQLKQLGGDLKDGLESADSCKDLTKTT